MAKIIKYIKRPRRIYYKNGKPYITFKNKKYSISGTDPKTILKIINKLSKKYKKKELSEDEKNKKSDGINKFLTVVITSKIYAGQNVDQ